MSCCILSVSPVFCARTLVETYIPVHVCFDFEMMCRSIFAPIISRHAVQYNSSGALPYVAEVKRTERTVVQSCTAWVVARDHRVRCTHCIVYLSAFSHVFVPPPLSKMFFREKQSRLLAFQKSQTGQQCVCPLFISNHVCISVLAKRNMCSARNCTVLCSIYDSTALYSAGCRDLSSPSTVCLTVNPGLLSIPNAACLTAIRVRTCSTPGASSSLPVHSALPIPNAVCSTVSQSSACCWMRATVQSQSY